MLLTRNRLGLFQLNPAPADLGAPWVYRPNGAAVVSDWHAAYTYLDHADHTTRLLLLERHAAEQAALAPSWAMSADYKVPAAPGFTYRPYQLAGIKYAMEREHTLIADVPRLGKSAQAIGVFNKMRGKDMIVVGPAVSKPQWRRYCADWIAHLGEENVQVLQGRNDVPKASVLVVNWDVLADYDFGEHVFTVAVFDECRAMKNEKSQRTRAALQINAEKYLYLDGTPINTRPIDLWPIVRRCDRWGLGANKTDFAKRYCDAARFPGEWKPDGASNLDELQRRMREKFMIRREKKDVQDEITSTRQMVWLDSASVTKQLHDERMAVMGMDSRSLEEILTAMVDGDAPPSPGLSNAREALAKAKLPHVIDYVDRLLTTTGKVVIYGYHRAITQALAAHYDGSALVIGGLTPKQRQSAIDRFADDPECRVFVGNITACNSAISLAAADDVVYAELAWIPTEMEQSEDRIWLPGKTAPLTSHWLMFEDSIDSMMYTILLDRMRDIGTALNREHVT